MRFLRSMFGSLGCLFTPFRWLFELIWRVVGPPAEALWRVLSRIVDAIWRALKWLGSKWHLLWASGKTGTPKDHYVGANGVMILATLTMFTVWYVLPIARVLEIGPRRFVLFGLVILGVSALAWRSLCREDKRTPAALWAQSVARTTGLRRLDLYFGVPMMFIMVRLAFREPQLVPLTVGTVMSYFSLLIQQHVPRASASVYSLPTYPDSTPLDPDAFEGPGKDVTLTWKLDIHGSLRSHSAQVRVSQLRLEAAREMNEMHGERVEDVVRWVVEGHTPEIDRLADQLNAQIREQRYSMLGAVSCYVAACQAIPYRLDEESTGHDEYWRFPIETLGDTEGDCEDTSILLAALLRRSGFDCALIHLPGHIAVGVHVPEDMLGSYLEHRGRRYYYCETTGTGWRVGDLPSRYRGAEAALIEVPKMGVA